MPMIYILGLWFQNLGDEVNEKAKAYIIVYY